MAPRERIPDPEPETSPVTPEERSIDADLPASGPQPAAAGLLALAVESVDADAARATLRLGGARIEARLDAAVHPVVVEGARARGERVIVQREGDAYVVLGALRTAPTPGIDPGDEYVIEARRIRLQGRHEVALAAGPSSVVLRALGHLELLSRNITARAEGVQKLFARVIHLN